ncbi:NgoFVII family restriction endonuclease [Turicibacter sanguinis]|uniref:restriction endonuclease PLD domain-containing protein n=1 Tax=Turicibacter sanguinis TaxID=154288 RepID=UPI0012B75D7C|nr:restriction endonuclease PLD domain-containing protein [Turicibacter sanguinis]MDB8541222.1 NgoFVII family restriction endonuclease [Turicibacter sanguinis]MTH06422.1 NgoFVII family restriction endonuclease [Turicibacter sanguinis]MTH08894.1 NgoFVII family restriction endonuclease [Turicibacter sanguinis]MTH11382.1 NgoFVII family restriction endonuclease [Turicibacter sanguinis]MTH21057.1 NgoFVII family restriction endonuclease [Turicibacter sanguinis]
MQTIYQYHSEIQRKNYEKMLSIISSLSNLFSDSDRPYLHYRIHENMYCKYLECENISRVDCSFDALKVIDNTRIGVGLKTFLYKNDSFEKVAEFNKNSIKLDNIDNPIDKIKTIANWRNERINFAKRTYATSSEIYHCIVRKQGKLIIYEEPMHLIDLSTLKIEKQNSKKTHVINFSDQYNHYKYNESKSTLFKKFTITETTNIFQTININILSDPFSLLESIYQNPSTGKILPLKSGKEVQQYLNVSDLEVSYKKSNKKNEFIILPLYSEKGEKHVPPKSGLNLWNASGRVRNPYEVEIRISPWIHETFPNFFPKKDTKFNLILPNNQNLLCKVCQQNGKALMSNPNSDLGHWLRDTIFRKSPGELITLDDMLIRGIDSVIIKKQNNQFFIDFASIGSYEEFKNEYKKN